MSKQPRASTAKMAPAVILGLGLSGLEAARALGRRRVPVIGLDTQLGLAAASRYCAPRLCADPRRSPAELVRELLALPGELGHRPVLVPLGDDWVIFVATHRAALSPAYAFVQPDPALVVTLTDKSTCYRLAAEHGIAVPRYLPVDGEADLRRAADTVGFPCYIKPALSADWAQPQARSAMGPRKLLQANDLADLKSAFVLSRPHSRHLLVQEMIPGPDADHTYIACYLQRSGSLRACFAHRKVLMHPPGRGVGCLIESIRCDEAAERAAAFLRAIGYVGIAGMELKLDRRDGLYKLLDLNPRFGQGDSLSAICGLDLLWLHYCDALDLPLPALPSRVQEGVKWVHLRSYLSAAWKARGTRAVWRSLADLRGPLHHAVFARDDLGPVLRAGRDFLGSRFQRAQRVRAAAPDGEAAAPERRRR